MASEHKLTVFGAGAVGGYLGGKLAADPNLAVTLVGRSSMVEAVARDGLTVRERGQATVTHPGATEQTADLPPQGVVMLCVRTYDVASSLQSVRDLMGDRGLLVSMQNGVGTEETLASEFGRDRVIAGTLTASVGSTAPGVIECFSRKGGVALASMDGHSVPPWLAGALMGSGLHVSLVDDYRSLRWSKLLLNMLGAASTTILDVDLSVVVADPGLFRIEQLVIREAGRVMDAMHVPTMALPGYPVPLVRTAMRLPLRLAQRILGGSLVGARGGRSPTMRADLARGKSEVGWTNGAVARAATGLGLPAPVNQTLTSLIEDLLVHPEHRDRYRAHPERLLSYMRDQGARV